ncbi:rhodanese-like domain-containing protein [Lactobacillus sp. 23-2]|uniref:rhodanese-like domain-containing protein n=1 Tax=Lactobacillus TaxID=1578 RepID=UPI001A8DABB8|nr:rhodanese-like domain-containing protein [Lactobacillus porci]
MSTFLIVLDIILAAILLVFLGFWAYNRIQAKRFGGELTNDEFKSGMHKAQIIDVREADEFKRSHIDGARNIPYTMFKYQYSELRPDLPVYLYSDSLTMTLRCVGVLRKHGFSKVSYLKDGFAEWNGRKKASKN